MPIRVVWLTIPMLLISSVWVHAAEKNVELLQLPSLFMFDGVAQSVSAEYNYAGHKEKGSSSSSTSMKEHYGVSTSLSMLDPHLVNMAINGGLTYTQRLGQTRDKTADLDYDVTANVFDLSYHPLTLLASRGSSTISNGYSPTYTLTRETYQLRASLLHQTVPVDFSLDRSFSQSSGLPVDVQQSSGNERIIMRHEVPGSLTNATLSHNSSKVQAEELNGYYVALTNSLSLDPNNYYQLGSSAGFSQSQGVETQEKNFSLDESLACRFGKALHGGAAYRYEYNSTLNHQGVPQETTQNSLSATLQHQLFQSLNTMVSARMARSTMLGGNADVYGSDLNLAYRKRLPADGLLTMGLGLQEEVINQNYSFTELTVRDEHHVVAAQGDEITPNVRGKLTSVFSVSSLTPIKRIYVEGIDYSVDLAAGRITVLLGGGIDAGVDLQITYALDYDPSVKYLNSGKSAWTDIAVLNGRYNFGGNISLQSQKVISGQASNQSLNDTTTFSLYANANYAKVRTGAEFTSFDGNLQQYSRIKGYWRYTEVTDDGATLALSFSDSYSMYTARDTSEGYDSNSASVAASYGRTIFEFLRFSTSVGAGDVRSGKGSTDFIMWRAGVNGTYNQLVFALNGSTRYRISGSTVKSDNSLQFNVTRYF